VRVAATAAGAAVTAEATAGAAALVAAATVVAAALVATVAAATAAAAALVATAAAATAAAATVVAAALEATATAAVMSRSASWYAALALCPGMPVAATAVATGMGSGAAVSATNAAQRSTRAGWARRAREATPEGRLPLLRRASGESSTLLLADQRSPLTALRRAPTSLTPLAAPSHRRWRTRLRPWRSAMRKQRAAPCRDVQSCTHGRCGSKAARYTGTLVSPLALIT